MNSHQCVISLFWKWFETFVCILAKPVHPVKPGHPGKICVKSILKLLLSNSFPYFLPNAIHWNEAWDISNCFNNHMHYFDNFISLQSIWHHLLPMYTVKVILYPFVQLLVINLMWKIIFWYIIRLIFWYIFIYFRQAISEFQGTLRIMGSQIP